MRRPLIVLLSLAMLVAPAGLAGSAAADVTPRASLSDIENDVMCVSCREPLAVAQSPQALAERSFIRTLIAKGLTKAQIEQQLVAQYGVAVLGRPPAHGFNLSVYILPPAILIVGVGILIVTLPRWRRRAKARAAASPASPTSSLDPAEAKRLDEDMARYG